MAREMLKLRKGDTAIMIKADGSIEMAGLQDKELVNEQGQISPVILFAAAWAKRDQQLLAHLVKNFQDCVREGYFGADAQEDYKKMEIEHEKKRLKDEQEEKLKEVEEKYEQAEKLTNPVDPTKPVDPTAPVPVQMDGKTVMMEPTETPEETAKRLREEANLQAIAAKGQDPRVKKQMDAFKKGAKKTTSKPYDKHLEPDLPVEQTMKYLKATPDEQKRMKEEEKKKKQIIGNATIEEKKDNEN